jgi:hypothetical protein
MEERLTYILSKELAKQIEQRILQTIEMMK